MLFNLGKVVATQGVVNEITMDDIDNAMKKYTNGDWGNVCEEDAQMNDDALKNEDRIVASYTASNGTDFWIITEWDRSVTTVLLPSEY